MSERKYPEGCSEADRRAIDPLSDLSAYDYGFSDQRPGIGYWIMLAGMFAFTAWKLFHG